MPNANIQTANAQAAPAAGIDALFAALLADTPQMPGNIANIVPPPPAQIPASQNNPVSQNDAAAAPLNVNIILPATPSAPQGHPGGAAPDNNAPVADPASAPDPAMAFVAPNMTMPQQPTAQAKDSKNNTGDPAALPPMPVIVAQFAATPVSQTPITNTQTAPQTGVLEASSAAVGLQNDADVPQLPVVQKPADKQTSASNQVPLAAPAAFVPPPQIVTASVKTANVAVEDAASAPKQTAPQIPAQQNADIPAVQTKSDTAIVAAAAQGSAKPAPTPQTTQAQALPVQFDLASNGQHAQTSGGNSQQQNPQQNQQQIQQVQAATPPAAPVHAPAAPQNNSAGSNNSASNAPQIAPMLAAAVQPPPQPVHVNAAIQVGPQSNSAAVPYNVGAIAVTVASNAKDGNHQFDIRLDPPELGSIAVHLTLDNSGQAAAHFTADKPQTLQLLQSDSGNLQSALKDAGLNLANNGLNFSLRGDQRQAGQTFQRARTRNLSVSASAAPSANPVPVSSYAPGALDITV